jgi:vacuolar-type H+-ATPase subunit E/Vma4
LDAGRKQSRAVRAYLEGLEALATRPRPRGKRTVEFLQNRIADLPALYEQETDVMKRLNLVSEQLMLEEELEAMTGEPDIDINALEQDFIANAKAFAEAKNVVYGAWRQLGVTPKVLREAGITR